MFKPPNNSSPDDDWCFSMDGSESGDRSSISSNNVVDEDGMPSLEISILPEFKPIGSELPLFENRNDYLLFQAVISDKSNPVDVLEEQVCEIVDLTLEDPIDMSDDASVDLGRHNCVRLNDDVIIDLTSDDD